MSNKLEDLEKSHDLANIINMVKFQLVQIDLDYAREMGNRLIEQGNFQDSAAVLNPAYSPLKSDILRKQGKALLGLVQFIEELKDIDKMKADLSKSEAAQQDIMKLFI